MAPTLSPTTDRRCHNGKIHRSGDVSTFVTAEQRTVLVRNISLYMPMPRMCSCSCCSLLQSSSTPSSSSSSSSEPQILVQAAGFSLSRNTFSPVVSIVGSGLVVARAKVVSSSSSSSMVYYSRVRIPPSKQLSSSSFPVVVSHRWFCPRSKENSSSLRCRMKFDLFPFSSPSSSHQDQQKSSNTT